MKRPKKSDIILAAGVVAGLLLVFFLSSILESSHPSQNVDEQEELYLHGERLKGFVFGSEGLIADWYWMRSLQYIGDKLHEAKDDKIDLDNLKPLNPKLLYPLLDNATTLDPQFLAVYSYGATVLPAIDAKQAIAIAKKGIVNNPDEWLLYHQLGFIYWKLEDYKKASAAYLQGSAIKDAPGWMKSMAARMNEEGGSRATARAIYSQLIETAGDDKTRESARLHLAELDSAEERTLLDKALTEFRAAKGRCPENWNQLIPILKTKELPDGRDFRMDRDNNIVDPTDAPYLIDSASCTAKPDPAKSKLPRY